jgi:hypothetical protein
LFGDFQQGTDELGGPALLLVVVTSSGLKVRYSWPDDLAADPHAHTRDRLDGREVLVVPRLTSPNRAAATAHLARRRSRA